MAHHNEEEEKNYDYLYYVVGLLTGLFIGAVIDKGFTWIFVGGVLGLLTAALFLQVLVKGREQSWSRPALIHKKLEPVLRYRYRMAGFFNFCILAHYPPF